MAEIQTPKMSEEKEGTSACCALIFRGAASLIIGVTSAYLLNETVIQAARLDPSTTQVLSLVAGVIITIGCTVFKNIRCLALLVSVGGTGLALRASAVSSLARDMTEAMDELLTVPVEIPTSSVTRALQRIPPLQAALRSLRIDNAEILAALRMGGDIIKPLETELSSIQEFSDMAIPQATNDRLHLEMMKLVERINSTQEELEKKHKMDSFYHLKLVLRAYKSLKMASNKCSMELAKLENICLASLKSREICRPFRSDIICNFTLNGEKLVDEADLGIPGSVSTGLAALSKGLDIEGVENRPLTPIPTRKILAAPPEEKKRNHSWLEEFLNSIATPIYFIARLTPMAILFSVLRAEQYRERFLRDLTFDNRYLTGYFIQVDKDRKKSGKESLLPLNSLESRRLTDRSKITLSSVDFIKIIRNESMVAGEVLAAISLWWVGKYLITAATSQTNIKPLNPETGTSKMMIQGDGMAAMMMRYMTDSYIQAAAVFQQQEDEDLTMYPETDDAAVNSSLTGGRTAWVMYGIVAALTLIDGLIRRAPSIICGFFYPEMEKKRVNYLYDSTLAERRCFNMDKDNKLKKAAIENKDELKMAWMSIQCACCRGKKDLVFCKDCRLWYCKDCWIDRCGLCTSQTVSIHPWEQQ